MDLTINFNNITEAQAITLVKAAKIMEWCGKVGTSRNVTFFADGDKAETSKINIPAILAAKTAGGAPHGCTAHNGISNRFGSDVFKLKKLRDDCYDCNC